MGIPFQIGRNCNTKEFKRCDRGFRRNRSKKKGKGFKELTETVADLDGVVITVCW
jgi:hypothetical protein